MISLKFSDFSCIFIDYFKQKEPETDYINEDELITPEQIKVNKKKQTFH